MICLMNVLAFRQIIVMSVIENIYYSVVEIIYFIAVKVKVL